MRPPVPPPRAALRALLALLPLLPACREGSGSSAGGALPIPLSLYGASGCNGPDQAFGSLAAVSSGLLDVGPSSQLAAATDTLGSAGTYELYATGEAATLVELVFDPADPLTPVSETMLLAPGDVDALAAYAGVAAPAELAGVAVLDPSFLVVVESAANTLLLVSRDVPGQVTVFPTLAPNEAQGNSDGFAGLIRFAFTRATQIVPSGDGRLFLADPGNHSLRLLDFGGGLVQSATVAGSGAAFFQDGRLFSSGFDTPVGLALACDGSLVVAELGAAGAGGHRLRSVGVGDFNAFSGGFDGAVETLVGDGSAVTAGGPGPSAAAAGPLSPVTTSADELYWVDSLTGVLRRYDRTSGVADCPLFADCAAANAALGSAPNFTSMGGVFSLAVTEDGSLYALDADAEELWRVMP